MRVLGGDFDSGRPPAGSTVTTLVHGLGFNESQWMPLRIHLAIQGHHSHVLSVNYLTGALSTDVPEGHGLTQLRDALARQLDPLLQRDCTLNLVGHSLGGVLSADLAQHCGVSVGKTVCISAPFQGSALLQVAIRVLPRCVRGTLGMEDCVHADLLPGSAALAEVNLRVQQALGNGAANIWFITGRMDPIVLEQDAQLCPRTRECFVDRTGAHYNIMASRGLCYKVTELLDMQCHASVSYTHLTLPTKRIV
eukprot:TRINITY_DN9115_c0_g1_i2.p1 TRINITY_DN9115_c0_g1~~TRINITY_DN9115_c0_g1_i2.p1  ORF type:complete len:251 (-),score=33.50 TRINITY_DN9115_c0_g1_i2:155-907(-)